MPIMTTEEFQQTVLAQLSSIKKAVAGLIPPEMTNPLVGTGETKPAAPTVADIVANPAHYTGTQWDPVPADFRISSTAVIANFETMSKSGEFPGGTLSEWARIDFPAVWRYIYSQYPGIDVNKLSTTQRKVIGL